MDYGLRMSFKDFQGLMMKWLFIGLSITLGTSLLMNLFNLTLFVGFYLITIIFSIIELILVFVLVKKLHDLSFEEAKIYFIIYSIINGITISLLLSLVGPGIASLAFLMTCAYFGLLYTITRYSKTDFIKLGHICMCALPILFIAYFILMFVHAPVMYYVVTIVDLVVFTGLTLYDMKKAERLYYESPEYALEAAALLCALELYLDFINIFLDIIMLIADNN